MNYNILKDVIRYDRYLEILFDNCMIDEKAKEILGHILISRGEKPFRLLIRSRNTKALIDRLKKFIPTEFIDTNRIVINELRPYFINRPIYSFSNNSPINILYDTSEINLTLDSMYIYDKTDEFSINDVLKFIISMHMIDIDYDKNIIDYLMDNKLNHNSINTILSLSIANAKINKQSRLEIDNIRYIMSLFRSNL